MNREEILAVIDKHLVKAVDEVAPGQMNPEDRFTDYGATSLDIVEIVSGAMRELKIKIPRPELAEIQNINGLVDKLLQYAKPKES